MTWQEERIEWVWDGKTISLDMTIYGEGPTVLLLPALSSISTRREMRLLQERIGGTCRTVALDWPGFGDIPRPKVAWRPDTYRAFLQHIAGEVVKPAATIAAGHAAGYAVAQAAIEQGSLGPLSLVSPTWRGPLPTMTGRRMALFSRLARAVDLPVVGALLYRLNVNRPVIGMMARGHVYSDPGWLNDERLREKLAVTEAAGARHSSFRFVTGELDLFHDRAAILATVSQIKMPVQVVYGADAPRKSKAEMTALAAFSNVEAAQIAAGKLSVYEECPDAVAPVIETFLHASLKR